MRFTLAAECTHVDHCGRTSNFLEDATEAHRHLTLVDLPVTPVVLRRLLDLGPAVSSYFRLIVLAGSQMIRSCFGITARGSTDLECGASKAGVRLAAKKYYCQPANDKAA